MTPDSVQLEWLLATQTRGIQPGLWRMERLLASLGNPERSLRCLHVAGTNGKGSVSAIAESMLRAAGHFTGLYTSPHLVDFAERIKINGLNVASNKLEEGIERLQKVTVDWQGEDQPTFFELVTALSFDLFKRAGCEVVVLETGLGGRLDATNVAPKLACAITPISFDHTEWLGSTLRAIAKEKAGILRRGIPVVISPQEKEVFETLTVATKKVGAPCQWITEPITSDVRIGLLGSHQRWNAALAFALLGAAGLKISLEERDKGLADVSWPGRFQRIRGENFVLDGAHNIHATRQLIATWKEEFGNRRCRLIFGALSDKDPLALLKMLEPIAEEILLVPILSPRAANPEDLFRSKGHSGIGWRVCDSLEEAINDLFYRRTKGGHPDDSQSPILLTGSLFLVGEALAILTNAKVSPRSQ